MKSLGLMGRVAVSFCVSTILPIFLFFLSTHGITSMGQNIFILALAGIFLVAWIYNGIVKPIDSLKNAARRIESGDLNFTLEAETHDEFAELTHAFEKMRMKLKQNQEEKARDEEENRELVSNIAHDLKTPITAIRGYAEGILDGVAATEEKKRKYLQTIYHKAVEMNRLIDELNYYAKIETNKIPYHFVHLPALEYFQDYGMEMAIDLDAIGFQLTTDYYLEDTVEVIADPVQLRKVLNNIVSNAVKYMDKAEPKIHFSLLDAGDFVEVVIEDNGKGIEKKDLPYIFERFYRSDTARSTETGGSGIGLSIVKKIIEDSGGRIWADSEIGVGTGIHFVLRKHFMEG
mgnify:FL=1